MNIIRKIKIKNRANRHITFTKVMFCLVLLCSITFLSFGYSALSENVELAGTVNIGNITGVKIIDVTVTDSTNSGIISESPTFTNSTAVLYSNLPTLTSTLTYKINIKNYNQYLMIMDSLDLESSTNNNFQYNIVGLTVGDELLANESADIYINISYKSTVTVLPDDTVGAMVFTMSFVNNINYAASSSLLLDLRGTNKPVENVWYDQNNNIMNLNNVTYDKDGKRYVFDGKSSFGEATKAYIPATGDFTAEIYILTQATTFNVTMDQAILSQVNNRFNDSGRMKINLRNTTTASPTLTLFYYGKNKNTNIFVDFASNIVENTVYQIQIVRNGNVLSQYVNGVKYSVDTNYAKTNKISQKNLKLGKWNNISKQFFSGAIYAARVYNKALSSEELAYNYKYDKLLYGTSSVTQKDLQEYILNNHIVSSGDGLYQDGEHYVYKGNNPPNYIKINDKVWRIMALESDGTIKLFGADSEISEIAFDVSGNRSSDTSTYCANASSIADTSLGTYYGCNAWNKTNVDINTGIASNPYISGNVLIDSSLNTYLNTTWYNAQDSLTKSLILSTNYNVGMIDEGSTFESAHESEKLLKWYGKVGLPSATELLEAGLNVDNTISTTQTKSTSNYLLSLTSSTKSIWSLTRSSLNTWDIYVGYNSNGGGIGKRRASRTSQLDAFFSAYPVISVDGTITVTGNGSQIDPFSLVMTRSG